MSDQANTIVVMSAILTVAIVAAIAFIFLLLIFAMIQIRRVAMNREIFKFIDNEKNDKLRASKKDLGKMYELCKAMWDKRAELVPIPEPARLPEGWIMSAEGKPIHIRTEIARSAERVLSAAAEVDPKFQRKSDQTVRQLLSKMLRKKVGTMKLDDCERYLSVYETARFGSNHLAFKQDDFEQFQAILQKVIDSMRGA